jgi:phospholipid transport system substrate-binding protein
MTQPNPRGGWWWLSILAFVLGAATSAQAGPATDQLKGELARVCRVIEETSVKRAGAPALDLAARREAIRIAAEPVFDWRELASRVLGRHWPPRSEAERTEFVRVFGDFINRAYIAQLERYNGEAIKFVGERVEGELALVNSRFVTKQSQEIPVDYRLINRAGRWLVYDVIAEGVSLVGNYRTQLDKVIRTSSYPEMLRQLRDKEVASR